MSNKIKDDGKITVEVRDHVNGPEIFIDKDPLRCTRNGIHEQKELEDVKNKNALQGKIRWSLDDDKWDLASIEFEGAGLSEFTPTTPPLKHRNLIHIINKFTKVNEEYKYTIWCAPRNGLGKPISLDPCIKNDPD